MELESLNINGVKPTLFSPPLSKWLFKNGMVKTKTKNMNKELTHVSMAGGRFSIPHNSTNLFLKNIEKIIKGNGKFGHMYFSECRTDIFRYMIDVDYEDEIEMDNDCFKKIIECILFVLNEIIKMDIKMIVLKSATKKKTTSNGELLTKTGIHLLFPDIFVNQEIAILLRSGIIQYLIREFGIRPCYNTWEDVIDLAIYKNAGLRMVGSNKAEKCKECSGREDCFQCNRSGKIDTGRDYKFHTIFGGDGNILLKEEIVYKKNTYKLLKDTIIRSDRTQPSFIVDKGHLPEWFNMETYKLRHSYTPKKKKVRRVLNEKELLEIKNGRDIRMQICSDNKVYKKLSDFIRGMLFQKEKVYKGANLINLYLCKTKTRIKTPRTFYIFQTDTKYCKNAKRHHTSNHIYFIINESGVYQKCHSEFINYDGNKCCMFKGKVCENLSLMLKLAIFPEFKDEYMKNNNKNNSVKEDKVKEDVYEDDPLLASLF